MSQDLWRVSSFCAFMKEQLCVLRTLEFEFRQRKTEIVNVRGGAAHFCPALSEPREARRGQNSVRAIFNIHRTSNEVRWCVGPRHQNFVRAGFFYLC